MLEEDDDDDFLSKEFQVCFFLIYYAKAMMQHFYFLNGNCPSYMLGILFNTIFIAKENVHTCEK